MKRLIRVGSRESKLAVTQTQSIINIIKTHHPELEFEIVTMKTSGDMILDRNLDEVGGKGLFVKELDIGLRSGQIDFAVHSLKDMPMLTPEDLPVVSLSVRENPYDALVLPRKAGEVDLTKPFGCSSARRKLQLERLYPASQSRVSAVMCSSGCKRWTAAIMRPPSWPARDSIGWDCSTAYPRSLQRRT
jgi:hydroxymethylbilane synthase